MKINFIPDKVLNLTMDKDLLGTRPYSDTIFEIVNNCEGKKNIGLFGSWGSGKSTILTTFENLIVDHNSKEENKNNRIAYFEFDAWKFSQDDFRRSFLIEFTRKFSINYEKKLHQLLYNESTYENPELITYKFNKFSLSNWIILVLVVFGFSFYYIPILEPYRDAKVIISSIALVISVLATALKNTINKYKVVVKENKLVEPERFEAVFKEIISDITSDKTKSKFVPKWIKKSKNKTNYNKVVIVIDNLDRCDNENLLVTLNTVKNFLEHDKVVFILPVDEKGISAFLSSKTDNTDEYLRKIFHLIIRLKEFSKKELFEFTTKINDTYELELNAPSIRIICSEFTSNPRKVIQFLNNYQSEMKLIEEQSLVGYIDAKYVKEHISFFIKLLIIKYEWKSLYDEILYDKSLLNKINNVITNLEPDSQGLYLVERSNVKLTDAQRNFFFSNQEIHCPKIDPFILNVDMDKDLPDNVAELIRNGNYAEIIEYLEDESLDFSENMLLQKINEVYSSLTFKHREYTFIALPVLKILISFILDDKQVSFRKVLSDHHNEFTFLNSLFKNPQINNVLDKFDFERLTKSTKWITENIGEEFFNAYINHYKTSLFGSDVTVDDENEKINIYFEVFKDSIYLDKVKDFFSAKITVKPKLSRIKSLNEYSVASRVISTEAYKKMGAQLLSNEDKFDVNRYYIFELCRDYVSDNRKDKVTRKNLISFQLSEIESFYEVENINDKVYVDYVDFFEKLNELIDNNTSIELSPDFISVLKSINNHLYREYNIEFNENQNFELYQSFFELVKRLIFYTKDFNSISYRTEYFGQYLDDNYSRKVTLCLNNILYEDVLNYSVYDYPFANTFIQYYQEKNKNSLPFGKTVIAMLEKSKSGTEGLSKIQKKQIIIRTINLFSIYKTEEYINFMKRLKKAEGALFLELLNVSSEISLANYVRSVKLLKDRWFYGNSVQSYLSNPLNIGGTHSNFLSRLREVSEIFNEDEQRGFLNDLFENGDDKIYKWMRTSHKFLKKRVFDVYLENLMLAHINGIVGHNVFFEWINKIPLNVFYKKRRGEFIVYLESLDIKHKTYRPKKERAIKYLVG